MKKLSLLFRRSTTLAFYKIEAVGISKRKMIVCSSILFFVFILWMIYLANTGQPSFLFDLTASIPLGDKLGHIVLFGLLAYVANAATEFRQIALGRDFLFIGTFAVSVFVIIEESSQIFFAKRTFDLFDLFADAIGISLFNALSVRIAKNKKDVA